MSFWFQAAVEQKSVSGGIYIEVSNDYRASQYDHTVDDYIKKKPSERMYKLQDGTEVQKETGIHHSYYTVTITEPKI